MEVAGSGPLHGEIPISGAKNSVLKLMAACVLAEGRHRLSNVPDIADVSIMSDLLTAMGAGVRRSGDRLTIDVPADLRTEAPYELVERMRASIVVLGPLLARFGRASVALPGGDDFGPRPIDMHLSALEALGARFTVEHGNVEGRADVLTGAPVVLEYPSVGATENVMMAAVLARGRTVVENAAREPEITDLALFLNEMGAAVAGHESGTITIDGVERLRPAGDERSYRVVADRVETATYLAALGVCGGELFLRGARADHMSMLLRKLTDMGMTFQTDEAGLLAVSPVRPGRLRAADISTLPYPGLATDYKPALVALLATARGDGIVTENIFTGRFRYIDELRRMGADIRTEGHHAVIRGVDRLSGAPVRAHDIRAGAALVVAGLAAGGTTRIAGAEHVARGYEDLTGKLAAVGAAIRVS
ncbi:MAG TPA: UDP-N-acetylglucosamine 1-carboxyvinyltransferase [Acidimicrobiaceae bacterium]|nr:UDP-N-acetylglucosamine 1-carboxyvinyltransferase [Acidimicrobiaceae bacterium]HCB37421.1 UDP-N-acetylglucosamine 1-carboxyvinyltransferase [Acidimicrobiaceae bacterium]